MSNNKYKVLIVDDEANIRSFIAAILESNGYQVLTAETCTQGRLVAASHNPDLIVLDLGLPDMDGGALIRAVRAAGSAVPIVVLSARSDESEKVVALDMGAIASANRQRLNFTKDEFDLIFQIMKEGKSEEEKRQMDDALEKARKMMRGKGGR